MNDFLPDPPRWKERLDQVNLAEREAGRAIRFMPEPEPLPAAQLTRIAARIRVDRPQRRHFWLTATAALLLGGATVAFAAHLNVLPDWLTRIVNPRPAEPAPHKRASLGASFGSAKRTPANSAVSEHTPTEPNSQSGQPPSAPDQAALEDDSAQPSPAAPIIGGNSIGNGLAPLAPRKPVRRPAEAAPGERPRLSQESVRSAALAPPSSGPFALAPVVPPATAQPRGTQVAWLEGSKPAPETSGAQGTAKYLSEAVHALRVEHSPGTALFLLDRHATQLGKGAFAHEALLLRVEAMLALGRKAEVLRLLDGAALTEVAASRSLLVTRGELRAAANRCTDGIGDFDLVLAKSKQADRQALFGRALCRKKLGDSAGAQADVQRYRCEFSTDSRLVDLERQVGTAR
jgi:hypothetical protein